MDRGGRDHYGSELKLLQVRRRIKGPISFKENTAICVPEKLTRLYRHEGDAWPPRPAYGFLSILKGNVTFTLHNYINSFELRTIIMCLLSVSKG